MAVRIMLVTRPWLASQRARQERERAANDSIRGRRGARCKTPYTACRNCSREFAVGDVAVSKTNKLSRKHWCAGCAVRLHIIADTRCGRCGARCLPCTGTGGRMAPPPSVRYTYCEMCAARLLIIAEAAAVLQPQPPPGAARQRCGTPPSAAGPVTALCANATGTNIERSILPALRP